MRKALKWLLVGVGAVVALAGAFAAFIALDWPIRAEVQAIDLKVEATPERLARGKNLVSVRCAGCHYNQTTGVLSGQLMTDAPKEFGAIYSHNITRHATRGLGRYTDGELLYLLRTGVRRDGVFTGPFMQSPFLGDEDMLSIIAFLRSDDPWVAPHDAEDRDWEPTFLAKFLMHVAFKPMAMPTGPIAVPDVRDRVAYGRYVAHAVGDCFVCHSADFKTLDSLVPERSGGYFGGGNATLDSTGRVVRTANLTMDPETGIGAWSEADFVRAVRHNFRPDGRALRYPMVPYAELTDEEVGTVFEFLKTVPVLKNEVPRDVEQFNVANAATAGEALYAKYGCFSCHGMDGGGVCDLRQASRSYDTDEKLIAFIKEPSRFVPNTKMPTWKDAIAEADYGPLVAYVHALERQAAKPGGAAGR